VVESQLEDAEQLEIEYVSEAKEKLFVLKARFYSERHSHARPAYRESRFGHGLIERLGTIRVRRGDRPRAIDRRLRPSVEVKTQSTPDGVILAVGRMIELLELPPGWNSYNAKPITKEKFNFAIGLLGRTMRANTPTPIVIPMVRGGVQLEWHSHGINLEISIYSPRDVRIFAEDVRSDDSVEDQLDLTVLSRWLDRLSV